MGNETGLPRLRFGDTDDLADELGDLAAQGLKTATCSAYHPGDAAPEPGDRLIVEDSGGRNLCVIEIIEAKIMRFCDVDAAFAHDEGEGDRTLAFWRAEHRAYFERNGGFHDDMLLLCERFVRVD